MEDYNLIEKYNIILKKVLYLQYLIEDDNQVNDSIKQHINELYEIVPKIRKELMTKNDV